MDNNSITKTSSSEETHIVLYHPDDTLSLEVKLDQDTVWLTQAQMVDLFGSSKGNVSEHITNIYSQGELSREATVRNFRTVRKEGNRMVYRNIDYYNLDMIISVGFRVNSHQGILFGLMLNDIFKEGELKENAVCKDSLHTAADGKKYHTKSNNLDVIISVGYRVIPF